MFWLFSVVIRILTFLIFLHSVRKENWKGAIIYGVMVIAFN